MKFSQIAASDAITQELVGVVNKYSTLLRNHIEFFTGPGTGSSERKTLGKQTVGTRAVGNKYTPVVLAPEYLTVGRKIIGATARVDTAYERMGMDIPSEMRSQINRFGLGIANFFYDKLINGDATTTATDFSGLSKLTTTAQTVISGETNGLSVTLGNDNTSKTSQQKLLEKINDAVALCFSPIKVILVSAKMYGRLNSIAREYIRYTNDEFGKLIATYNGIPIINVEEAGTGIMKAETVGTATTAQSIYVVGFGERELFSFFTVSSGFMVYPMIRVDNFYESVIEFIADSALFQETAVSRLSGIVI